MRLQKIAEKLGLEELTPLFDQDIDGVYISDMISDVIANAKPGNLLVTVQVHANVVAAANLVDVCAIILAQGKRPSDDVLRMAEKAKITVLSTSLNRWQVASKLYEVGLR